MFIRGVPGRLPHHFIEAFATSGRMDLTNREICRTPSLTLADFKDSLEAGLILLRRRLEEKDGPVELLRPERGRIRLAIDGMPRIEIAEG